MFIRMGSGVIAVDAPPALGELLLTAIEKVIDEPVTHFIYSHWHADHVGAAAVFGPNVKRYGHEKTRELLLRFPDPNRPPPTETFATYGVLDVNGVQVDLSYKGQNHCEGNIFIYVPKPYITKKMLEKTTSNGKTWAERPNGADVMTKHNAYYMPEKTRLEKDHNGYVKRGNIRPPKYFT